MKKLVYSMLALVSSLALGACFGSTSSSVVSSSSSSSSSSVSSSLVNTAPTITGVQAEVDVNLGESFSPLVGVTANDAEDGNLTSSIVVTSIPAMVLVDGQFTPEEEGEYYLTYSVTDSNSLETKEYTTLFVSQATTQEELFKTYIFEDNATVELDGWEAGFAEGAAGTMTASQGRLVFDIDAIGTSDWHAKFFKVGVEALAGAEYELIVTMSASVPAKMHYIVNNAALGWSPEAGTWNLEIGTSPAAYSLKYDVDADSTQIEYLLQMGGDLNLAGFELYIDRIEVVTTTGSETESEVVNFDFADQTGISNWGIAQHETATSNVAIADGKLNYTITNYATEGQPWNMNLYYNTGYDLVNGKKYKLTFDYTVAQDQFFELCFEDSTMDWQVRAGFNNGTLTGSGSFSYTFFASMDITGLYIKWALGRPSATGANVLAIDNFRFIELVGDKVSESAVKTFEAVSEEAEWGTYNANGGVGTIYTQDGKLYYAITSFGATDWYNKLFIKSVVLSAGALYKVEFVVKADKELKGFFALNVVGQWDPRITAEFDVGTEDTTITYTMDSALVVDVTFELLFQFGGYPQNVGPATLEFSEINIYALS